MSAFPLVFLDIKEGATKAAASVAASIIILLHSALDELIQQGGGVLMNLCVVPVSLDKLFKTTAPRGSDDSQAARNR